MKLDKAHKHLILFCLIQSAIALMFSLQCDAKARKISEQESIIHAGQFINDIKYDVISTRHADRNFHGDSKLLEQNYKQSYLSCLSEDDVYGCTSHVEDQIKFAIGMLEK